MRYLLSIVFVLVVLGCGGRHNTPVERFEAQRRRTNWKFIFLERKKIFLHTNCRDTLRASFAYFNDTGKTQAIDTVKVNCGCTSVSYSHKGIKNGERGEVVMAVKMSDEPGFFSNSAVVYFHGEQPVMLEMKGTKD